MVEGAKAANAWPLEHSLDDEVMTRTHAQLDVTVDLTESEIGAWTSSTQERVSRSLKIAVRTVRAMAPRADRSGLPCWVAHCLTADQRDAALELLLVAADDAAVQLAIASAAESARRHAEGNAFHDTQAELVARIEERITAARAEGAEEARRAAAAEPAPVSRAPRSRRAPVVRLAPKSKRGVRRAS